MQQRLVCEQLQYALSVIIPVWIFDWQDLAEQKRFRQSDMETFVLHIDNFPRKFSRSNLPLRLLAMFFIVRMYPIP